MNRKEQLTYLEYLRNLESISYHIKKSFDEQENYRIAKEKYLKSEKWIDSLVPQFAMYFASIALIAGALFLHFCVDGDTNLWQFTYNHWLPFLMIGGAIALLIVASVILKDKIPYNRENKAYNKELAERTPQLQADLETIESNKRFYAAEYQKVNSLLAEAYDFNIIPLPYRNLKSIIYIYEYMSTSAATLTKAL